jgi:hypothetical protein
MTFELIGHPDLEDQVQTVFRVDPKEGPVAVARIRALLESFDDDPDLLEPAPVERHSWTEGVILNVQRAQDARPWQMLDAKVGIYVYEEWKLRFAIAQVEFPGNAIVGAWLLVEPQAAAAAGIASRNLCQSLLVQVQEITWPF